MSSRRETDPGCCRGEGVEVVGKGEREKGTGEHTKRTFPHSHWLGKQEGLHFVSSCNQQCVKSGVFKGIRFSWFRALRYSTAHGQRAGKQRGSIQHGYSGLKSAWGTQWGDQLLFSEHVPQRQSSERPVCRNKAAGWHQLLLLPLTTNIKPPAGSSALLTLVT